MRMTVRRFRAHTARMFVFALLAGIVVAIVSGGGSAANHSTDAQAANAKVKTIRVVTDPTYAPYEFVAKDGKTLVGIDIDLARAIGREMGVKVKLVTAVYSTIIPGLAAKRYDMAISGMGDLKPRQKIVDFVDYGKYSSSFLVRTGTVQGVDTYAELCGKRVGIVSGTGIEKWVQAQQEKCSSSGQAAIEISTFASSSDPILALKTGRIDIYPNPSDANAYIAHQSKGELASISVAPGEFPGMTGLYGIALPKKSPLTRPVLAAVQRLVANGRLKAIFAKYGLAANAVTKATLNRGS